MTSHAEPLEYYNPEKIINIDRYDEIKLGLTWTLNDQSVPGTVERFLDSYGKEFNRPLDCFLGGHRTISGRYSLRADGAFVQIHNPDKMQIYYSHPKRKADPDLDIIDIEESSILPRLQGGLRILLDQAMGKIIGPLKKYIVSLFI